MDKIIGVFKWLVDSGPDAATKVSVALLAICAIFAMIPGDQPEKFLHGIVDFLAKFSRKPKE